MLFHPSPRCQRGKRRRGIAPLEFVLALPFLVLAFCLILATGFLGIGRTLVSAESRYQAWKQRDQAPGGKPLFIQADQPIDQTTDRPIKVLPGIQGLKLSAQSRTAVLGGTWDHRALGPDESPFDRTRKMATSLGQGLTSGLPSLASLLGFGSNLSQSVNQANDALGKVNEERNKIRKEVEKAKQQLEPVRQQIQKLTQEVNKIKANIKQLDEERKKALKLTDAKQRKETLEKIDRQLDSARAEVQRVQATLKEAEKKLRELQGIIAAGDLVP